MAPNVHNKPNWDQAASVKPINRWITPESNAEEGHQQGISNKSGSDGRGAVDVRSEMSDHEKPSPSFDGFSQSGHPANSSQRAVFSLSHHQRYVNGRHIPALLSSRSAGGAAVSKQSVEVDIPSSKTSEHSSESEDKLHPGWIIETPAGEVNDKNGWIEDNVEKKIVPSVDVGFARRASSASQASVNANVQVSAPRSGGKRMSLNEYIAETSPASAKVDEHICKSCGSIVTKKKYPGNTSDSVSGSIEGESATGLISAPDSRRTSTSSASLAPSLPRGYISTDIIYGWGPGVTASTPVSVAGDTDAALSSRKASTASIASSILYPKPLPSGAVTPEDLAYGWGPSSNTSFSKEDDLSELSLDIAKRKAGISPQASIVSDVTVKEAVSPTATTFSETTLVDDYKPSKIIGWKDDNDDVATSNPSWNGWDLSSKMQQAHLSPKYTAIKAEEEMKHDVKKPPTGNRREHAAPEKYSNNKDVRSWSNGVGMEEGGEGESTLKNSYFSSAYQSHLRGSSTSKFANHQLFHGHNDWE